MAVIRWSTVALLLICITMTSAFTLSNTLGDNMVLQRDRDAIVWGFGTAGTNVSTTIDSNTFTTIVGSDGIWRQSIGIFPASLKAYNIEFKSTDGSTAALNNVLFGDVHICSGQSNMQFTLKSNAGVPNLTMELEAANNYPYIRIFTVGQKTTSKTPLTELGSIEQLWSVASNETVGAGPWTAFSAVCWFTYRDIFDSLGGQVPQGLISDNWGGTPIQDWVSAAAGEQCNVTGQSSILWNAMVAPYTVGPMAIRTAIWYQGEANVGAAPYYACQFPVMIADWRKNFPGLSTFGFVQIAACNTCYGNTTAAGDLRQAQLAALSQPKVVYAISNDLVVPWSGPGDIHPTNKQAVARRLSGAILYEEYGNKSTEVIYPVYKDAANSIDNGEAIVAVALDGCGDGCYLIPETWPANSPPNTYAAWEIYLTNGNDNVWVNATARLSSDKQSIVLTAAVPGANYTVAATAYGRAPWPITAAYSNADLPLVAWCFTTQGEPCYQAYPAKPATDFSVEDRF